MCPDTRSSFPWLKQCSGGSQGILDAVREPFFRRSPAGALLPLSASKVWSACKSPGYWIRAFYSYLHTSLHRGLGPRGLRSLLGQPRHRATDVALRSAGRALGCPSPHPVWSVRPVDLVQPARPVHRVEYGRGIPCVVTIVQALHEVRRVSEVEMSQLARKPSRPVRLVIGLLMVLLVAIMLASALQIVTGTLADVAEWTVRLSPVIAGGLLWLVDGAPARAVASWALPLGAVLVAAAFLDPIPNLAVSLVVLGIVAVLVSSGRVADAWLRLVFGPG